MKVGVEIGGTFTDLVCIEESGIRLTKVPSTPRQPDRGVFHALEAAAIPLDAMADLAHGSTVATNAVLERKGARLALLVTEGFRDVLQLRRQDREQLFDIFYRKPDPLVPRYDTLEVPERVVSDGGVVRALDMAAFGPVLDRFLAEGGHGAVAICLLNAFANPAHERAVAEWLAAHRPGLPVTCSVDVTREFREYERTSTTTLAAYVQPVLDAYLSRIEERLAQGGFAGRFSIMQSNGGRVPATAIRRNAVSALLSGPAAGVTGAIRQASLSGHRDIITLDIGGTSADVCLVQDGRPELTREARVDTLPVLMPMVDITTIGAGGGSLVWVDDGGLLRVGPRSAGADPGPACYGRGGTQPTLTDAHVICGRLPADARLAGSMKLDAAAARAAFAPLAAQLGLSVEALADSAIQIAVANIVSAIRLVSTSRGRDPRDYALVPFGGAGPLHAAAVAEALAIGTVVVPPNAGVISAYGLLAADYSLYDSLTRRTRLDADAPAAVRGVLAEMLGGLQARADAIGLGEARRAEAVLEMRYVGQAFEIPVPLDLAALEGLTTESLLDAFAVEHRRIYRLGAAGQARPVEIVSYRVGLHVPHGSVPSLAEIAGPPLTVPDRATTIFDGGRARAARRMGRAAIGAVPVAGPLTLDDLTAAVYVPEGWTAATDPSGNLILRRGA
ncbi:hydantoinase/oxoprolinase family protein [Siccirubricoccus phaeus]|uniref:hydantoinase/oxoprolinase family protein n=1 Tax=Siccirubricoccus phaeus TaxID=2595053 RepID=UPI0011F296F8|nr:hydantoinase/oxoprolinase family protein [Siccirubricoccus phaeus]